jgi:hypothetical protein
MSDDGKPRRGVEVSSPVQLIPGMAVALSPIGARNARIVERSEKPLILIRFSSKQTSVDFVERREGETLHLASGRAILGRHVIAAAEFGIPLAMPNWGGPGRGLWDAAAAALSASVWDQIRQHPGGTLSREQESALLSIVFKGVTQGMGSASRARAGAAKETPILQAGAPNFLIFENTGLVRHRGRTTVNHSQISEVSSVRTSQ